MIAEELRKVAKIFRCSCCDYTTSRKSSYDKHLSTRKHKMIVNDSKMIVEKGQKEYDCICGKSYKHDSNYHRHKKSCTYIEEKNTEEKTIGQNTEEKTIGQNTEEKSTDQNNELVIQLMQQNQNLQNLVVPLVKQMSTQQQQSNDLQELVVKEIIPKIGNNNTSTNCNNNNNNKFNMNIYLNEKCKDAIPLMDFIENLKITDKDYDTTRTEGIVSGLTDVFTKELRNLDVRQLPIHCSDLKRETFYIKNEDKWVKDDSEQTILSKAIDKAKDKANKFLPKWLEDHPLCWKQDNNHHTEWMDIVTVRYGKGDPNFNEKNTKKILKTLATEVLIDKENAMIDEEYE